LRPILDAFGEENVRAACLDTLGYPAEMIESKSEVESVKRNLNSQSNER
jgi:hypothetical protein